MQKNFIFKLRGGPHAPLLAHAHWFFRRGQQWVVTGPNGSGKSYLAAVLAGHLPRLGITLEFAPTLEERVALVSFEQHQAQVAHGWLQARWHWRDPHDQATVRKFLSYNSVHQINPFEVRQPDREALDVFAHAQRALDQLLDLQPLYARLMLQLSNGEMRRVLLAHALLQNPGILILDDPFAGLDHAMTLRLKDILNTLAHDGLPLILMVRHLDEIPTCMTHHLHLHAGKIVRRQRLTPQATPRPAVSQVPVAPQPNAPAVPIVEMRAITIRYRDRTLWQNLNWRVNRGERWLVIGPNGAGKSTLLSLISGDNPTAYAHDIRVFGQPRQSGMALWQIRRRIGEVSPEIQAYCDPRATVWQTLLDGWQAQTTTPHTETQYQNQAQQWLQEFDLAGQHNKSLAMLSAGQQRLVFLARALLGQPDLLLLDEPCLNLDPQARQLFLTKLADLFATADTMTIIYVAHHPNDIPRGITHVLDLTPTDHRGSKTPPTQST